ASRPDHDAVLVERRLEVRLQILPYQRSSRLVGDAIDFRVRVGKNDERRAHVSIALERGNDGSLRFLRFVERRSDLWNRRVPIEQVVEKSSEAEVVERLVRP